VEGRVPELNFTGSYQISGKLLGHSIEGLGPLHAGYRKFSGLCFVLWLFSLVL